MLTEQFMTTPASVALHSELVRMIETSAAKKIEIRKKINKNKKKSRSTITEQSRYAKLNHLKAVAVTLTYSDRNEYSKKNITAFINNLRRILKNYGCSFPYVWTLEYASHLHYHLILWLPRDFILEKKRLSTLWKWGSTWIESCKSPIGWGRYISKFDCLEKLPRGARSFGSGGLDKVGRTAVARAGLPQWLIKLLPKDEYAVPCSGGGRVNPSTGEIFRSPYVWTPRGCVLRKSIKKDGGSVGEELGHRKTNSLELVSRSSAKKNYVPQYARVLPEYI